MINPADINKKLTYRPAVSPGHCDKMAKKYNWVQPSDPKQRYKPITDNSVFNVDCGFYGDAEFPEGGIGLGVKSDD